MTKPERRLTGVIGKIVSRRPGSDLGYAQELKGQPVDLGWGLKGVSGSGWHSDVSCFIKLDKGWQHVPDANDRGDWTSLVLQTADSKDLPLEIRGDYIVVDLDDDEYLTDDGYGLRVVTLDKWLVKRRQSGRQLSMLESEGEVLVREAKVLFPLLSMDEIWAIVAPGCLTD